MADIQVETPPAPLGSSSDSSSSQQGQVSSVNMDQTANVSQGSVQGIVPPDPVPPKAIPELIVPTVKTVDTATPSSDAVETSQGASASKKTPEPKKPEKREEPKINPAVVLEALQNSIIAGNIPQIVLHMITYATAMGVSDVHIEPMEKVVRLRFRVDGVLRLIVEYPLNIHPAVVSRVKIMSGLKIDEQRVPQDGRMQITTEDGKSLDLRVSTLPTVNGEKIVSRIQDKSKSIPDLPNLGIQGINLEKMEKFTKLPNGVILVTGPTGSGKTNTLYSTLTRLNTIGVNIMTFEDPVEYQMDGLSQSQMKPEIDYNFASGLRTALRQDPDIIMVGEIRDQETIEIAIRAALTGHLVLSTIHTNSAVGTLTRITDMGVKGFLIASAIRGIIAQRLVRTVCPHCKEFYTPEPKLIEEIKKELSNIAEGVLDPKLFDNPQLARGKGCDLCGGSGNKGRMGLFEIMEMSRELGTLVINNAPDTQMMDQAQKDGMITLKQDGYIKALQGDIPIEEVYRVVQ